MERFPQRDAPACGRTAKILVAVFAVLFVLALGALGLFWFTRSKAKRNMLLDRIRGQARRCTGEPAIDRETIDRLNEEVTGLEDKLKATADLREAEGRSLAESAGDLEERSTTIETLQKELADRTKSLTDAQASAQAAHSAKQAELEGARDRLAGAESAGATNLEELRAEVTRLEGELTVTRSSLDQANTDLGKKEDESGRLIAEMAMLAEKHKKAIADFQTRLGDEQRLLAEVRVEKQNLERDHSARLRGDEKEAAIAREQLALFKESHADSFQGLRKIVQETAEKSGWLRNGPAVYIKGNTSSTCPTGYAFEGNMRSAALAGPSFGLTFCRRVGANAPAPATNSFFLPNQGNCSSAGGSNYLGWVNASLLEQGTVNSYGQSVLSNTAAMIASLGTNERLMPMLGKHATCADGRKAASYISPAAFTGALAAQGLTLCQGVVGKF